MKDVLDFREMERLKPKDVEWLIQVTQSKIKAFD